MRWFYYNSDVYYKIFYHDVKNEIHFYYLGNWPTLSHDIYCRPFLHNRCTGIAEGDRCISATATLLLPVTRRINNIICAYYYASLVFFSSWFSFNNIRNNEKSTLHSTTNPWNHRYSCTYTAAIETAERISIIHRGLLDVNRTKVTKLFNLRVGPQLFRSRYEHIKIHIL